MGLSTEEVRHVALLSRLELTPAEVAQYTEQLGRILEHADQLRALDTDGLEPMISAAARGNVFREDRIRPGLPRETVLAQAPEEDGEFFRVPAVIE